MTVVEAGGPSDWAPPRPGAAVTLVVCTYTVRRLELLRGLLASVAVADPRPDEVIVVVDRDAALHASLERELAPVVSVLFSAEGGLSAARNVGWRAARGDWISFVDDDAVVAPDWLGVLRESAEYHGASIAGGRIDPRWDGDAPAWYSSRIGWVVGCTFKGLPTVPAPVRSVIGCNMLVRRSVLQQLEGFSRSLGRRGTALIGSEETELCIRAGMAGAQVVFVPGSRAWQVVPPDRRELRYAWRRAWGEGRSKARLSALHGRVLGVEQTYTRALLRESMVGLVMGALARDRGRFTRAAMLVCTLATTVAGYAYERVRVMTPTDRDT